MASLVRVLGGAPGGSICLRIFWNRIAFFCRFRALGERTQWQKPCVEARWVVKESWAKAWSAQPSSLCSPPQKPNPRTTAPKQAALSKRVMKYVTGEGTRGPKGAEHLPLRL